MELRSLGYPGIIRTKGTQQNALREDAELKSTSW